MRESKNENVSERDWAVEGEGERLRERERVREWEREREREREKIATKLILLNELLNETIL